MMHNKQSRLKNKLKLLLLASLFVVLIIAVQYFPIQENITKSILWIKSLGTLAPIIFIIIYNVATVLFIPCSLLTIKAGFLFGAFWGSIYVFIAALIGATWSFLIGRYLSRDWVYSLLKQHPKFKAINQAVAKEGWKIVLLTRLSPIFPFNLLNYAFGITQVALKDYVLGSLGIIPGVIMYVYIGSVASDLSMLNTANLSLNSQMQIWQGVIKSVGLIATVGITIYITRIAQKALTQSIDLEKTQD
jgi:uncharacterized membrane protein YdjX (TVP38/TMEM64 family)